MRKQKEFVYHTSVPPEIIKFAEANNYEKIREFFSTDLSSKNWATFNLKAEPIKPRILVRSIKQKDLKDLELKQVCTFEELTDPTITITVSTQGYYHSPLVQVFKDDLGKESSYLEELERYDMAKRFALETKILWTKLKSDLELETLSKKLQQLSK